MVELLKRKIVKRIDKIYPKNIAQPNSHENAVSRGSGAKEREL